MISVIASEAKQSRIRRAEFCHPLDRFVAPLLAMTVGLDKRGNRPPGAPRR
jgi:hypothetical protein